MQVLAGLLALLPVAFGDLMKTDRVQPATIPQYVALLRCMKSCLDFPPFDCMHISFNENIRACARYNQSFTGPFSYGILYNRTISNETCPKATTETMVNATTTTMRTKTEESTDKGGHEKTTVGSTDGRESTQITNSTVEARESGATPTTGKETMEDPKKTTIMTTSRKATDDCYQRKDLVLKMTGLCDPTSYLWITGQYRLKCRDCGIVTFEKTKSWGWHCGSKSASTDLQMLDEGAKWWRAKRANETHAELYIDRDFLKIVEIGPDVRFACPHWPYNWPYY